MNSKSALVFGLIFFSIGVFGQSVSCFDISIGIFSEPRREDFQALHSLGFLYASATENNHAQVFMGTFESRAQAESMLGSVRNAGYTGAVLQEHFFREGRQVYVVQLGAADFRRPFSWAVYEGVADLWGLAGTDMVRLVTGPYQTQDEARKALPALQAKGFKDAFVRSVNTVLLIRIGSFETGNTLKKPLIAFKWNEDPAASPASRTAEPSVPTSYDTGFEGKTGISSTVPPVSVTPRESPAPSMDPSLAVKGIVSPVRSNVKRRAALELQKILKEGKYYEGSLDGFYGQGTAQGYEQALARNNMLVMYRLLVGSNLAVSGSGDGLQAALDHLTDDARSIRTVESSADPVALAYQAYALYIARGPSVEVNNRMNEALHRAYASKPTGVFSAFDYQASYAYNDLNQLILHLYYIHAAPKVTYTAPCWLSKKHPQESARAQSILRGQQIPIERVAVCDAFSEWEEVRMLESMASDIGAEEVVLAKLSEAAAARAALFAAARPLSEAMQRDLENWHTAFMNNLHNWEGRDPLHRHLLNPFRLLFYQGAIRMEDFFMDKGFGSEEAKYLALATLRTIVGPRMTRFQ